MRNLHRKSVWAAVFFSSLIASALLSEAVAADRFRVNTIQQQANDADVDLDGVTMMAPSTSSTFGGMIGTIGDFGEMLPEELPPIPLDDDGESNFNDEEFQIELFQPENPFLPIELVIDGTQYQDDILIMTMPDGTVQVVAEARVNNVVVLSEQATFLPQDFGKLIVRGHAERDYIVNETIHDLNASGGFGDDTIVCGYGYAQIDGDSGYDVIVGLDTIQLAADGGFGGAVIYGGEGNDYILAGDAFEEKSVIYGNGGNDSITGGRYADEIHGGSGADVIWGWEGEDTIFGDSGNDQLAGGDDTDIIRGGDDNDEISGNRLGEKSDLDDDHVDFLYGDDGADVVHVHDYFAYKVGIFDHPMDFNEAEGDSLYTHFHWIWW